MSESAHIILVILALVGSVLGLAGLFWLMRWRRIVQPARWGLVELVAVGLGLVLGTGVGVWVGWRLVVGDWDVLMADDSPLAVGVIASAAGSGFAGALALVRAPARALGLRRARWVDFGYAALWLLPFWGLSVIWAVLLEWAGVADFEQDLVAQIRDNLSSAESVVAMAYGLIWAPIVEELLFRGFLLPPLVGRLGVWPGVLLGGLIFGAMHGSDPWSVPPLVVLGVILGQLRVRSGSILPPLLLHVANNASVFIAVIWEGAGALSRP